MQSDAYIDSVRLHLEGEVDAERRRRARLRVSGRLEGIDWHPPELPPSAVLLIRRVEDPAPGGLDVEEPGAAPNPEWERALRETLGQMVREADRPRNGRIEEGADAILFRDEAEAWACWYRLKVLGVRSTWWARSLLQNSTSGSLRSEHNSSIADHLDQNPRLMPAIVGYWSHWEKAVDIASELDGAAASRLLKTMCETFGVGPASESDTKRVRAEHASGPDRVDPSPPRSDGSVDADGSPIRSLDPPWTKVGTDPRPSRTSLAHRQWLGIARALDRAPGRVRADSFRRAWRRWIERTGAPMPGDPPATSPPFDADRDQRQEGPGEDAQVSPSGDRSIRSLSPEGPGGGDGAAGSGGAGTRSQSDGPSAAEHVRMDEGDEGGSADRGTGATEGTPGPSGDGGASDVARSDRRDVELDRSPGREWGDLYTASELGGVWYLINAIEAARAEDEIDGPDLDGADRPWAVLEMVARGLLRGSGEVGSSRNDSAPAAEDAAQIPYSDDPVWRLLAKLDGRDPETPAVDALPALEPWGEEAVPRLRRRIEEAVGTDDLREGRADPEEGPGGEGNDSELIPQLLVASARIYHTRTHLDVVLSLEQAKVAVRRAGLDQDPGWLPTYGRVIQLHFRE